MNVGGGWVGSIVHRSARGHKPTHGAAIFPMASTPMARRLVLSGSEASLEDVQTGFGRRAIDVQRREHEQHVLLLVEKKPARATLLRHAVGVSLVTNVHGDRHPTPPKLQLVRKRHLADT